MKLAQVLYTAFILFGVMVVVQVFWPLLLVGIGMVGFLLWKANRQVNYTDKGSINDTHTSDVIDISYVEHEIKED
ncbi:MAG: hypothetical protein HUJ56_02895 [Erysipelotrichaceae bacterium]|nr:hypothetical protein [Erysipelotrichaceae bacterium]